MFCSVAELVACLWLRSAARVDKGGLLDFLCYGCLSFVRFDSESPSQERRRRVLDDLQALCCVAFWLK